LHLLNLALTLLLVDYNDELLKSEGSSYKPCGFCNKFSLSNNINSVLIPEVASSAKDFLVYTLILPCEFPTKNL